MALRRVRQPAIGPASILAVFLFAVAPATAQPLIAGHLAGPTDGGPGNIDGAGTTARLAQSPGHADGNGASARFNTPRGLAGGAGGVLFVCDTFNHVIRRVTPGGDVTSVAGGASVPGAGDGTGAAARFSSPSAITFDDHGMAYIVDRSNQAIRQMTVPGYAVTTVAGYGRNYRLMGHVDGAGPLARFFSPLGIAANPVSRRLVLADNSNHTIRELRRGVARDFDSDARADAAVYRASTGTWYVRPSGGRSPWIVVFGAAGDVPLIGIR